MSRCNRHATSCIQPYQRPILTGRQKDGRIDVGGETADGGYPPDADEPRMRRDCRRIPMIQFRIPGVIVADLLDVVGDRNRIAQRSDLRRQVAPRFPQLEHDQGRRLLMGMEDQHGQIASIGTDDDLRLGRGIHIVGTIGQFQMMGRFSIFQRQRSCHRRDLDSDFGHGATT